MREINECTAEVFRRSEKRIKERKRNLGRIFAICIPLFFIVSVWSVTFIPAMLSENDKTIPAEENTGIADSVSFSTSSFIQVEQIEIEDVVTTSQSSVLICDGGRASQIYNMMRSAFLYGGVDEYIGGVDSDNDITESYVTPDDENKDLCQIEDADSSGYKVTFTTENGAKTVFIITKDTLIDESTGQRAALTEELRTEIFAALGLTVTWEEEPK